MACLSLVAARLRSERGAVLILARLEAGFCIIGNAPLYVNRF